MSESETVKQLVNFVREQRQMNQDQKKINQDQNRIIPRLDKFVKEEKEINRTQRDMKTFLMTLCKFCEWSVEKVSCG